MIPAGPHIYAHFIHRAPSGRIHCSVNEVLAWDDSGSPLVFNHSQQRLQPASGFGNFAGVVFDERGLAECGHKTNTSGMEPQERKAAS